MTAAMVMGFDWEKLRLLKNSFSMKERSFVSFQPGEIQVASNKPEDGPLGQATDWFEFAPHFGWTGAIER